MNFRLNPIFGLVGVAGHKLYRKKVKAAASHRQSSTVHWCCFPAIQKMLHVPESNSS